MIGEMEGNLAEIELPYSREMAKSILVMSALTIVINFGVLCCICKRRSMRTSSTAIIVSNLACIDILVTGKDAVSFLNVSMTGRWTFVDNWCSSYGLTSVIFIIISVSTLVTISSERFSRLREIASAGFAGGYRGNNNPLVLGYVIAHTTLSYSLSLLWSKYIFISRKAFCRVEWAPRYGFPIAFMSSIIFVVPVSALLYNTYFKTMANEDENSPSSNQLEKTKSEIAAHYEKRAQKQVHIAVAIFLCSWTPYVIESLLSSHYQIPPNLGIIVACLPMFITSLLPLYYVTYQLPEQSRPEKDLKIIIQ